MTTVKTVYLLRKIDFGHIAKSFGRDLEVLTLDIGGALPLIVSDIGSLEHLNNLRHLGLPQGAYSGIRGDSMWELGYNTKDEQDAAFAKSIFANRFPSGLETLTILEGTPRLIPHLWYCHSHRSEILPNLKTLNVWEDKLDKINSHRDLLELKKAFEELGIAFSYFPRGRTIVESNLKDTGSEMASSEDTDSIH